MAINVRKADRERYLRKAFEACGGDVEKVLVWDELGLELETLAEETGEQLQLAAGGELEAKLAQGLKQVRTSTGPGSVCSVVEVAPWSRIPEARALLVPRDE